MCKGWRAGQDPGLLQPYPEHGSATVRGRALDLRFISPASVSPGVRGVWEHCTTVARLQSPPCRAAWSAHQSSGQISILSSQARYPRPAACCATKNDASAESLCQNEPRRARVRAENWLLQVSVQRL